MSNDKVQHVRKDWMVDVSIDEHEGQTRANARLRWRDQQVVGVGTATLTRPTAMSLKLAMNLQLPENYPMRPSR